MVIGKGPHLVLGTRKRVQGSFHVLLGQVQAVPDVKKEVSVSRNVYE